MGGKHAGVGRLYVNQLFGSLHFFCHVYILHILEEGKSVDENHFVVRWGDGRVSVSQ